MGEIDRYFEEDCNTAIVSDLFKKAYELGYRRGVEQYSWISADTPPPKRIERYLILTDCDTVHDAVWTNEFYYGSKPTITLWHWNGKPQYSKVVGWTKLPTEKRE